MIDVSGEQPRVASPDNYFLRRRWDYFVKHLLGAEPPPYEIGRAQASRTTTSQ